MWRGPGPLYPVPGSAEGAVPVPTDGARTWSAFRSAITPDRHA
ncbi:hypothetical protein [Streptomyces sp. NBC_00005]